MLGGILNKAVNFVFGDEPAAPGVNPALMSSQKKLGQTGDDVRENTLKYFNLSNDFFNNTLNPMLQRNQNELTNLLNISQQYLKDSSVQNKQLKEAQERFISGLTEDRSEAKINRALADYTSARDNAQAQAERYYRSMGIRPFGQRMIAERNRQSAEDALAKASIMNQIRTQDEARRDQGGLLAFDIEQQKLNQLQNAMSNTANFSNALVNNTLTQQNFRNNTAQNYTNMMGTAANIYSGQANVAGKVQGIDDQRYAQQMGARNAMIGAFGQVAGMYAGRPPNVADGGQAKVRKTKMYGLKPHDRPGKVVGPGNGIDDKIPAMLSNGEYVIPADVVEKYGVAFFDNMVQNNHVPAAIQRQKMKDKENTHRKKQMKKTKGNVLGKKKLGLA